MLGTSILRADERARILDAEAPHSNAGLPQFTEAHSMRKFQSSRTMRVLARIWIAMHSMEYRLLAKTPPSRYQS